MTDSNPAPGQQAPAKEKRWARFLPLLIFVALAIFFLVVQLAIKEGKYDPMAMPSALVGKPFPAFELPELYGDEVVRHTDLLGQESLVNVWATWCPTCVYEHPFLNRLASQGVAIYGVDYKDTIPKAKRWLDEKGNPYVKTIFDKEGRLGLDLGVTGAPETYVVDHRGIIRKRYQGALDAEIWQKEFADLMAQLKREREQGGR